MQSPPGGKVSSVASHETKGTFPTTDVGIVATLSAVALQ